METNNTQATNFSTIAELRLKAIDAERGSYGARLNYAAGLNDIADSAWYEIEGNGKLPENIQGEKDAYYDGLRKINYSNPSNAWKMIKKYAKEDAAKRGLFGEAPMIDEEETKGAGNKARPLNLRLIEELTALYKACHKAETLSAKEAGAFEGIKTALRAMGVDLSLINEGK